MAKIITLSEAAALIKDGMTVGISGFGAFASPDSVLDDRFPDERMEKIYANMVFAQRGAEEVPATE